jgi:1,4-alpha-glucan branching enzyme
MLEKKYLKTKPECEVTFIVPSEVQGETVHLVGEFNNWDNASLPMKRQKDGSFALKVKLPADHEYQFRYLINGTEWHNDWSADRYVGNGLGEENSVVVV